MSTPSKPCRAASSAQRAGVGLVELLVALVIGAFMISAAAAVYLKARDVRSTLDETARLQEIARYAMATIESDVRMAGYWGLTNRSESLTANPALAFPAKCGGNAWVTDTGQYITGSNNAYLTVAACPALSGGATPGADVLVVRRASATRIAPQKATISSPNQGRVLIVTSHTAGQVFVPQDIGNAIPSGYATADIANQPPRADTRALLVQAYYVSAGSSVAADYPALRRKTLVAGPDVGDEEVIAGIDDLQFQIGLDTNGDAGADEFVNAGPIPAGATPVVVRVWLRLRAQERSPLLEDQRIGGYADRAATVITDRHLRLLVARSIQLRNAGS